MTMSQPVLRTVAVAALAFSAGLAVAHLPQAARAAAAPLQPAVVDLAALTPADLPTPGPATPNLRQRTYAVADGATVSAQIGTIFKHYHADANEIQIVLEGTGTEWLGDKTVALKPGTMVIVPAGTPHGGTTETTGHLKVVAIKTPPQAATDTHPIP